MRIHVGCELGFDFPQTIPMIVTLNVHFSRFSYLERPYHLVTKSSVPVEGYRDSFGAAASLHLRAVSPSALTPLFVIRAAVHRGGRVR
jgi:hypothetical protein